MTEEILLEAEDKMQKAIDVMENRFLNVRLWCCNTTYSIGNNISTRSSQNSY